MSFPTTGILDNFNRSNVGPPPSASWSQAFSGAFGQFKVVSNRAAVNSLVSGYAENYYNVANYGSDCEAYVTIVTKPANATMFILGIRLVDMSGAVNPDGYILVLNAASGTDTLQIDRVDNGARTILGTTYSQEIAAGDSIGIRAIGSTLTAWHKPSAGSWTSLFSRTDSTYTAAGRIEIITTSTATVLDDFGGGTYVPYTMALAQGSASLTGQTVTLTKTGAAAAYTLAMAQGANVLSGQAALLKTGRRLTAAQGSAVISGQVIGALFGHRLTAAQGGLTLVGQTITPKIARMLACAQGTTALSGQAVTLSYAGVSNYTLALAPGAITLAGKIVTVNTTRKLSAVFGTAALSGQAARLLQGHRLPVAQGSFTLASQVIGLRAGLILALGFDVYAISGQAITFDLFGAPVTTPMTRILSVEAEDRRGMVEAEDRRNAIEADHRSYSIGVDLRTSAVDSENRTVQVR